MALHTLSQSLDFLYSKSQGYIYLRAKVTVELDIGESISQPVNPGGTKPDFSIALMVIGDPNENQDGSLSYNFEFKIPIIHYSASENADSGKLRDLVRMQIEEDLGGSPNEDSDKEGGEYTVTTKVEKAGAAEGEVKTTISTNGDIELD